MELEVKLNLVLDAEEIKGHEPHTITGAIINALEVALENTGLCKSCLTTIKPVTNHDKFAT